MKRTLILLAVVLLFPIVASSQTGFPPYGSFEHGRFDAVNRQNLNSNFGLPIVSVPARGGSFQFALVYNSLIWKKAGTWYSVFDANGNPSWGWASDYPTGMLQYASYTEECSELPGVFATAYYGYSYTDPAGTLHFFNVQFYSRGPFHGYCSWWNTTPKTGYATDGSGYFLDASSPTAPFVYSPSGIRIDLGGKLTDTNGNFISATVVSSTETDWTDTAGHTALIIRHKTGTSNCTDGTNTWPACIEYEYKDTSGTAQVIKLFLKSYDIQTNFGCSGVGEYSQNGVNLPDKLLLVNGHSYTFTYEDSTTGHKSARIRRVTLPTGGYYEYQYPTDGNKGVSCADGSILNLTRVISAGESTPPQWTYVRTQNGSNWITKITAPQLSYDSAANVSKYTFNSSSQLTAEEYYQGSDTSGTLLRTINTTWATNGSPSSATVILEDGSTQTKTDTTFDNYGNLTQKIEYAWGATTPVRTTQITYLSTSSYTSRNIRNRPTQILVRDGGTSGTIKSRTDITYDDSGYINTICPTGVAQHDDANYGCNFTVRGLPTSSTTYATASTPSGGVTTHSFYDFFGNLNKTDVSGTQQQQWSFGSGTNYAYPDSVTIGPSSPQLVIGATYNSYTGQVVTSTDENSKQTSLAYDNLKRVTSVTKLDGSTTIAKQTYAYDDDNRTITVSSPLEGTFASPTKTLVQKSYFDTLGRAYRQEVRDQSSSVYSTVDTNFDTLGRPFRRSNPYTSSAQYWTETRTDALGRVSATHVVDSSWAVQTGNSTTYSYSLKTVTVTDPAGKARKSETDALGRLVTVYEPDINNPTQLTVTTSYTYNMLDLLTGVTQGSQGRSFTYDDMERLTQQTTPEAGTWNYTYNVYNQVATRTDARGVITTYTYDTLNRPYTIAYDVSCCTSTVPATNTVTYTYGTSSAANEVGWLTRVTNTTVQQDFTYDALGRALTDAKGIAGNTYTTTYTYGNLSSEVTQITYPSGRVVKQDFDAIGRLSKLYKDATTTYADTFGYGAAEQITGFNYGNGVAASFGYSGDRLQLTSLAYNKSSQDLLALSYYYKTDSTNCPNAPSGNNGQIQCIKDNSNTTLTPGAGGRSVTYTDDPLNRLSAAVTSGSTQFPAWGLSWTYDRYGNRTAQSISSGCTGLTCPTHSPVVDAATNRIHGSATNFCYDNNGNLLAESAPPCPAPAYKYDAENHLVDYQNSGGQYTYDGSGLRVKRVKTTTPTVTTVYIFSGANVIAEYDNGAAVSSPTREYIFLGRSLLAKFEGSTTTYYHQDRLSNRVTTNTSGSIVAQNGHFPFGENWYPATNPDKLKFTSYERDDESSNDYAIARTYINRFGRFSSPDPIQGSMENPQSLNRYAYVLNDPIDLIDPWGLLPCWTSENADGPGWVTTCLVYIFSGWGGITITTTREVKADGTAGGSNGDGPTLGIKAPNQTFNQCMAANAGNYSLLGVVDFALNANGQIADNVLLGFTPASNTVTNIYNAAAGSLTSLFQTGPTIAGAGMGSVITYGRRTSSSFTSNLQGTPGGSTGGQPALGPAPSNASQAAKVARFQFKIAVDVGFFLAEVAGCTGPAKP